MKILNGRKSLDFANDYAFSIIGKFIFASLIATFRHGREEDEVMGISFKKELVVDRVQVQSGEKKGEENSKLQVIINHIQKYRVSHSEVWQVIWVWQIKICKLEFVWRWFWNPEAGTF